MPVLDEHRDVGRGHGARVLAWRGVWGLDGPKLVRTLKRPTGVWRKCLAMEGYVMETQEIETIWTAQGLLSMQSELGLLLMLAIVAVFIAVRG